MKNPALEIEVSADGEASARAAARILAAEARAAVASRGSFVMAVSGGHTPWRMLRAFAGEAVPWKGVQVVQVDERVLPEGHPDRNLTHIEESLVLGGPIAREQIHAMPVESTDLEAAAGDYVRTLRALAGTPPVLDLVHLGLGPDGHTASLVPGDPVLEIVEADVAPTGIYAGVRRMTMTFPMIDRSRRVLWLVTGSEKAAMLERLRRGDASIPAGRVRRDRAIVLADRAAAGEARSC